MPSSKLSRVSSRISRLLFTFVQYARAWLFPGKKRRILFSDKPQEWEKVIRKGFRFSRHEISFREFTPENIRRHDLVVPLNVADLELLDSIREQIAGNPMPIPSLDSIRLCDDKYRFNQTLVDKGFGNFIPKIAGTLAYPYILKKKTDEWGKNCHIIHGPEQEQQLAGLLHSPEYFSQELITGRDEFATHILFSKGKIVCSLNIRYVFETPMSIKGQEKRFYKEIVSCPYLEDFSRILAAIGFEGLCCFNYKVRDSRPYIIEINPRFGGSLCPYFFSFVEYLD